MDAQYKYIYYDDPMSESKRRKRRTKNNNPYSKANVMSDSPTNNIPDSQHVRTITSWDVKQDYRPSADQNHESCINEEYKSNAHYEYGFRATYLEWQPMFDYYSNQKLTTRPSNENKNDSIVSTSASSNSSVDRNHSSLSFCDYREEVDEDVVHPNMHPTPSSNLLEGPPLYHKCVSVGFSSNQRAPFLDPLLESSKDRLLTSGEQHLHESRTQLEVLDRSNDAYNYDRQTPDMRRKPLPSYLNIPNMYDNKCSQSFENVIGSCLTSNDSRVSTQSDNVLGCEPSADEGDQVYTL
ncbi:hypothetical protein F5879DRAFT_984200 [Lentinula edodes]|nr:hypothetical protein F5879DRAFT_984200 [Lentinula edodes]